MEHHSISVLESAHDVVIVGGGAAGIAAASSLKARAPDLDIAVIDPADLHCYQPGWTMVGAGEFSAISTAREMERVIPRGVHWLKAAVIAFEPDRNIVILSHRRQIRYRQLVVCPGLKLDWRAIEGLEETLGRNGVTSNYLYRLAPYTWELVKTLRGGRAIFTQPSMPIKCAGAPQKAMYLSSDYWRAHGALEHIDVRFCTANAVLFGVAEYVPALMKYVESYGIDASFNCKLVSVNGASKVATFSRSSPGNPEDLVSIPFDMLHVVPPQVPPDVIRTSPLADAAGWMDLDPSTLRHKRFDNIFGLGDAGNTGNAKTAAAIRKQAPVVANNLLLQAGRVKHSAVYDGYGACPLTVERGKVVLAEFLYGGKLAPTFPAWLINGEMPSRMAWHLKKHVLPKLYWNGMLKGREWLVKPQIPGIEKA